MSGSWEYDRLLILLERQAHLALHPAFLSIIAVEISTYFRTSAIEIGENNMSGLERATGQHSFEDARNEGARDVDLVKIDFVPITRNLNALSTKSGVLEVNIESLLRVCKQILGVNKDVQALASTST